VVDYCYTQASCYGDKIPTLTGELLMTREFCCGSVRGASWGGGSLCEACTPQDTEDAPYLPSHASSKYQLSQMDPRDALPSCGSVSNKCIAVRKVATPLRELTCHMGSHSVTCHPAEVTFPPLPQPIF